MKPAMADSTVSVGFSGRQRSRGFAFVEMPEQTQAQTGIRSLNGKELQGKEMSVSEARPRTGDRRTGEDEWKIIAAGTVINPVLAEKRATNGTASESVP
jgi:RNA recognition motif-containing protein